MVVLGVLIVIGTTIVGVTIVNRLHNMSEGQVEESVASTVLLSTPHGSRIQAIDADEGLLFVSVQTPRGDIVVIVDIARNQVVKRLELVDEQ